MEHGSGGLAGGGIFSISHAPGSSANPGGGVACPFSCRRTASSLCRSIPGDGFGNGGAKYAANRDFADIDPAPDADPFRRNYTAGKYAGRDPDFDAVCPNDAFCPIQSGDPVPWSGLERSLACILKIVSSRLRIIFHCVETISTLRNLKSGKK